MKTCTKCKIEKPLDCFSKRSKSTDGKQHKCKECQKLWINNHKDQHSINCEKWRDENREYHRQLRKEWALKNPQRNANSINKWRKENPMRWRNLISAYEKARPHSGRARTAKRKAAKIKATPKWANYNLIRLIYETCTALSIAENKNYNVDHIVPLQSDLVCGLHVEYNLQIILASENNAKSNKWWPDMP